MSRLALTRMVSPSLSGRRRSVVLFGWAGGDMRYVQKYAKQLWIEDLEADPSLALVTNTFSITTPLGVWNVPDDSAIEREVRAVMREVEEVERDELIVHVFSNGGLIYASRALRLWREDNICPMLVVLDSSPSLDLSPHTPALVVAESLGTSLFAKMLRPVVYCASWVGMLLLYRSKASREAYLRNYFGMDELGRTPSPLLFLYSSVDRITNAKMLESFVRNDLKHQQCCLVDFGDSPHVGHYRMHRHKYVTAIREAIDSQR